MIFKTSEEWEAAVVSKQKRASWRYGSRCGKRGKGMFLAIFKYIKDQLGFNSSAISLQKARPTTHTWLTPQPLGTLAGTAWRFACNCAAFFCDQQKHTVLDVHFIHPWRTLGLSWLAKCTEPQGILYKHLNDDFLHDWCTQYMCEST